MSPLSKHTIEKKLLIITQEISFLNDLLTSKISEKSSTRDHYAMLHSLQKALSAAIDITQHIVSEELNIIPESYSEGIKKLSSAGYLDHEFAEKFSEAARFRNKLVHVYEEINIARVIKELPDMLQDLKIFTKKISDIIS